MRTVLALMATLAALAPALAASEIRSVTRDADGNAILRTAGGAKIIVIGEGDRLAEAFGTPAIVAAPANCRDVGIVVRGRSFMYGVASGDPVPVLSTRICD